jgi:hypothetical protein
MSGNTNGFVRHTMLATGCIEGKQAKLGQHSGWL